MTADERRPVGGAIRVRIKDQRQGIDTREAAPAADDLPKPPPAVADALALARRGFHVFPVDHPELPECVGLHQPVVDRASCARGKHPFVRYSEVASTDEATICDWFGGAAKNIGVNCGRSGLVVIDEDRVEELARYAADHGVKMTATFTVSTAKGNHYYFRAPEGYALGNAEGDFRDHAINVRAGNGYVVGPGSLHVTGVVYTITDDREPVPLPGWIEDAIRDRVLPKDSSPRDSSEGAGGLGGFLGLPDVIRGPGFEGGGERHNVLMRYASSLRSRDLPLEEATILHKDAWRRCEQPPGCTGEMTWGEAEELLHDVYRRYPAGRSGPAVLDRAGRANPGHVEGSLRHLRLTRASDIEARPVQWAWKDGADGRIPSGSLSIAGGREGTGKSSFGIWMAARVTRGVLPGALHGTPRNVFYLAVEDSWEFTLVPRLQAAGADLERIFRLEVVNDGDQDVILSLPLDNLLLEECIEEHEAALVIIDPIMSVLADKINASRAREVRSALDPLAKMAARTGAVVLCIAHFNKGRSSDPTLSISESKAFTDVPRSVFTFARDEENQSRVMSQTKNSLGRDATALPSLQYAIESRVVITAAGDAEVGVFTVLGVAPRSVAEIHRDHTTAEGREERTEVDQWLFEYLEEAGGSAEAAVVFRDGRDVGFTRDVLQKARKRLGLNTRREGYGPGSKYLWSSAGSMGSMGTMDAMDAMDARVQVVAPMASMDSTPSDEFNRGASDPADDAPGSS